MKIKPTALYLTDNGACYCGDHLGITAKMTGRDLSGQPIHEVTPEDVRSMRDEFGADLVCEYAHSHTNPCTVKGSLLVAA